MNRKKLVYAAIGMVMVAAPLTGGSSASADVETARPADAFVDSIGVNVHLGYDNTYKNYETVVKPRLRELGVRHIRDGCQPKRADVTTKLKALYDTLGIRALLICGPNPPALECRDFVKNTLGVKRVDAVEGINEPDGFLKNQPWAKITREYQRDLWTAFSSDPATKTVPVVAPSLTTAQAAKELGDLSAWATFGNLHNYYGGRNPESPGWGDNGYGSIAWNLTYMAAPVSGSKPVWATETGWHNALASTGGHLPTPENVVARYMPRLFFTHFNRNIVRSYPYEFLDEGTNSADAEANFGLIRADNTPKPAFIALRNLIGLLKDPGPTWKPAVLDYALSGQTDSVQHTLLQKRDGTFYLALWVGSQIWEPNKKTEIPAKPQTVTLTLRTPIIAAATCRPNDTSEWTPAALLQNVARVTVDGGVVLVRLSPRVRVGGAREITPKFTGRKSK